MTQESEGRRCSSKRSRAVTVEAEDQGTLTIELLRRATTIAAQYAELDRGLTDAAVMAVAEREQAPVLTFDSAHNARRTAFTKRRRAADPAWRPSPTGS